MVIAASPTPSLKSSKEIHGPRLFLVTRNMDSIGSSFMGPRIPSSKVGCDSLVFVEEFSQTSERLWLREKMAGRADRWSGGFKDVQGIARLAMAIFTSLYHPQHSMYRLYTPTLDYIGVISGVRQLECLESFTSSQSVSCANCQNSGLLK